MKNGNTVTRGTQTGTGGEVVRTMSRRMSQPPFVSLFGGVAPTGAIAEEGLRASRANQEEEEREAAREKIGRIGPLLVETPRPSRADLLHLRDQLERDLGCIRSGLGRVGE